MDGKSKAEKIDVMYMRRYTDKFAEIFSDDKVSILQNAIDSVYNMFLGIDDIFPTPEKVREVYGLLVAWYIADFYPEYTFGIVSTGGGYLRAKKIGGVSVQYNITGSDNWYGNKDYLQALDTNIFGKRAKMMIDLSHRRLEALT